MSEPWLLIIGLAVGTFSIRLGGYLLGARLPITGAWKRSFEALPGCLIAALIAVILVQGEVTEWIAACIALATALLTRNLPLTMIVGIAAVWTLRQVI